MSYGTSQKTDQRYSGEFRITKAEHTAAYASAGLSYDTKFDLSKVMELPFNDAYFSAPPHAPHGRLGHAPNGNSQFKASSSNDLRTTVQFRKSPLNLRPQTKNALKSRG